MSLLDNSSSLLGERSVFSHCYIPLYRRLPATRILGCDR
jgi:hypothetical protein